MTLILELSNLPPELISNVFSKTDCNISLLKLLKGENPELRRLREIALDGYTIRRRFRRKEKGFLSDYTTIFGHAINHDWYDYICYALNTYDIKELEVSCGRSTLIDAITKSTTSVEVVRLMLEKGANPNIVDKFHKLNPLASLAATFEPLPSTIVLEMAELLVKYGAEVNAFVRSSKESILTIAVKYSNYDMIKWLLSKGADPTLTHEYKKFYRKLSGSAIDVSLTMHNKRAYTIISNHIS